MANQMYFYIPIIRELLTYLQLLLNLVVHFRNFISRLPQTRTMIISVINHTSGQISDKELQFAIRAINRQIREDFEPYWSLGATLRLEGRSGRQPNIQHPLDMRGDAVIYMWDESDVPNALGYHDRNFKGIPFGFVFTELSREIGENWSVTLSHEALELIADPEVNLLVMGPHPDPDRGGREVFHWYEMCDAVQAETYVIDEIEVSNFVLPLYFTGGDEFVGRNDYLGTKHSRGSLRSFGINPGGYVGFYDPVTGNMDTATLRGDKEAARRIRIKEKAEGARRALRYKRYVSKKPRVKLARQEDWVLKTSKGK